MIKKRSAVSKAEKGKKAETSAQEPILASGTHCPMQMRPRDQLKEKRQTLSHV